MNLRVFHPALLLLPLFLTTKPIYGSLAFMLLFTLPVRSYFINEERTVVLQKQPPHTETVSFYSPSFELVFEKEIEGDKQPQRRVVPISYPLLSNLCPLLSVARPFGFPRFASLF